MRLVEWNCRMALQRKLWLLEELNTDIAVVLRSTVGREADADLF